MAKVNLRKKPQVEVTFYLDVKDPESPIIVFDTSKLDLDNLPENILKIVSKWERPNFLLTSIINSNSYSEKMMNGQIQRYFDVNALVWARIRVLLKEWNLHEFDSALKLEFEQSVDSSKVKIVSEKSMAVLGEIDPPSIVNYMYNKAMEKIFPEESLLDVPAKKDEEPPEKNEVKEG